MNIKIPLIATTSLLLSANAVSGSNMNSQESQIKEVREGEPARVTQGEVRRRLDTSSDKFDLEGVNVQSANGEVIGDIDKVVQSKDKKLAVIGLGGSLKEVAVPLDQLSVRNDLLVIDASKAELEAKKDIDMTDFEELEVGQYAAGDLGRSMQTMAKHSSEKAQSQHQRSIDIEGVSVVNAEGETLGDIDKVVANGDEHMAVIGLSGSLKEVAVPLSELSWDKEQLVINASKAELESKTDIDMTDFEELEPGEYSASEFARFESVMPKQ